MEKMTDENTEKQESNSETKPQDQTPPQEAKEEKQATTTPMMDNAKEIAEKQEKANQEHRALLDRQEKMMSEQALAGKSFAGGGQPAPLDNRSDDQKDIDAANNMINSDENPLMPNERE